MFLPTLRGHGTIYLQSLPFSRMADRILAHAPSPPAAPPRAKAPSSADSAACLMATNS
jgi:hypothetical protein